MTLDKFIKLCKEEVKDILGRSGSECLMGDITVIQYADMNKRKTAILTNNVDDKIFKCCYNTDTKNLEIKMCDLIEVLNYNI